jgi:hypothetical protein
MTRTEASKKVGWKSPGRLQYPSVEGVEAAIREKDGVSILRWHRFLSSPRDNYERQVLAKIAEGFKVFDP